MDTNRSFLDNLNAGRKRRPGTALEHISRTLQEIEEQLDRAYAGPVQHEDEAHPEPEPAAAARPQTDEEPRHGALHGIVAEFQRTRDREADLATMESIAAEVRSLRDELGSSQAGMNEELRALRANLHRFDRSTMADASESDVAAELERLSAKVSALGANGDERTFQLLRLDIEQLRAALNSLAREDTVRSVERRFEEMAFHGAEPSGQAVEVLGSRLQQIVEAVDALPDTQALRSLEDKVRMLAGALDQFIEHSSQTRPDLHQLIDDRLDEISRAIAATAAAAKAPHFDPAPLERLEARVASLARQIEEVVEDNQSAQVVERLAALAGRVEEIAGRMDLPADAMNRMAAQIASISAKIEQAAQASDPDRIYEDIERHVSALSQTMARNHQEAVGHGERLFDEVRTQIGELAERIDRLPQSETMHDEVVNALEAHFGELSARLAERSGGLDAQAFDSIEARLEELALRLNESSAQVAALDPQIVHELHKQIGELADHVAQPGGLLPDFEDVGPRLTRIERTLAENRESMVEAAHRAAEEMLASLRDGSVPGEAGADLSAEIKALETLARRSDDRNARTFEAIHDTLIKIVEHLSTFEGGTADAGNGRDAVKLAVGAAPSLDPLDEDTAYDIEDLEAPREKETGSAQRLTPAEAAAAAAEAALSDSVDAEPEATPEKRSMLGGLTRAFASRKERATAAAVRKEPAIEEAPETASIESMLDEEQVNEPLEPGSGAPDLNAIMRRVRDEGQQNTRHGDGDAAKADFIAAARRAAQAAAAEAETLKRKKNGESRGSGGRFGIGGLLRSRKSTALMAVAAIAIVAGGASAVHLMSAGHEEPVKVALAAPDTAPKKIAAGEVEMPASLETTASLSSGAAAGPDTYEATDTQDATVSPVPAETVTGQARSVDPEPAALQTASLDSDETGQDVADTASAPLQASVPDDRGGQPAAAAGEKIDASLETLPENLGPVLLRQAALSGDPKALFAVAERYARGDGVETDAAIAAKYYEKAAQAGLAPAQYRIGNDYEKGVGVPRDIAKAKEWYRKAAGQGNASAMHNLGVLHAMGAEGNADNGEAAKWFARAAELGVKDSQFNLGILAAKGVGVKQDLQEAYKWFALVAETGDADAADKRDEIAKVLDADALKEAKARAELWKAKPVDRAANVVDLPAEWTDGKTTAAAVDMKKAVANIQLILNKNGYSAGPADGVMGEKTKSAIVAFQKDHGLKATGEVDTRLVEALLARK